MITEDLVGNVSQARIVKAKEVFNRRKEYFVTVWIGVCGRACVALYVVIIVI